LRSHRFLPFLLLGLGGCHAPGEAVHAGLDVAVRVQVSVEQDPTVAMSLWANWETPEPGVSWVEYRVEGEASQETSSTEVGTVHRVQLLGLPPDLPVKITVHTSGDDGDYVGDAIAITGSAPSDLPEFTLSVSKPSLMDASRFALTTTMSPSGAWIQIIDRLGRPVWYHGGAGCFFGDAKFDVARGEFVIHSQSAEGSSILRIDLTAPNERFLLPTKSIHHAVAVLPDGAVAYISEEARPWTFADGTDEVVFGDTVFELSADGSTRQLFSTWDWGEPQIYGMRDGIYGAAVDWTHANALSYLPDTDTLLLSLRNPAVVLEIGRDDGVVVAEYGGTGDDWGFAADTEPFSHQHGVVMTPAGTLLMMSTPVSQDGQLGSASVAIEYALDEARHELVEVWRHGDESDIQTVAHGGVARLPQGNTLVNWGDPIVLIREVQLTSEAVWEVEVRNAAELDMSLHAVVPFSGFTMPVED